MNLSNYKMRETTTAVYFWGGPLSQWFSAHFCQSLSQKNDVLKFCNAEQYMMAAKATLFSDDVALAQIMQATDPKVHKEIGRRVRNFDESTWAVAVPDVLIKGNLAKFSQNPELHKYLVSTAGKRLVEGSPVDRIYGVGLRYDDPKIESETNWRGQNLLGNGLEVVRDALLKSVP